MFHEVVESVEKERAMARTKEPPKPIYPIKHEFFASLDALLHQAGMLRETVKQALDHDMIDKRVADIVRDRLEAFDATHYGAQ